MLDDIPLTTNVLLVAVATFFTIVFGKYLWTALGTPGPWGIPILGYYPFLRSDFHVHLHQISRKHGEVYLFNVCGQSFVYLGSLRAVKDAHVNKAEDFPSRGYKHSIVYYPLVDGIAYIEGDEWKVQRKFLSQCMREIGLSAYKEELKGPIAEAVHSTVETLGKSNGQPIKIHDLMTKHATDIVLRLILGDVSDEMTEKLNEAYLRIVTPITPANMMLVGTLAKILLLPRVEGYSDMISATKVMHSLLNQILEEHKATFDINQQPRDFIDLYLREKQQRNEKNDPNAKYFKDKTLVASLVQIFGDGSASVAVFIMSFIRWLSHRTDIQTALYEEIVRVVGTERFPTVDDRQNLPLANSAMKEILRVADFITVFPDLESTRDTTVLGVYVPKGTITLTNLWAIHHDPKMYDNPDTIDITRFLPEKKTEPPIVFGIGRRSCAGEGMVMSEIFLFVTGILQNFEIVPVTDKTSDNAGLAVALDVEVKAIPRPGGRYGPINA